MSNVIEISPEEVYFAFAKCFPILANRLGRTTSILIVENAIRGESGFTEPTVASDEHQSAYFETVKSALQMASALIAIYNFIQARRKDKKSLEDEKELVKPIRLELKLPETLTDVEISLIVRECKDLRK